MQSCDAAWSEGGGGGEGGEQSGLVERLYAHSGEQISLVTDLLLFLALLLTAFRMRFGLCLSGQKLLCVPLCSLQLCAHCTQATDGI